MILNYSNNPYCAYATYTIKLHRYEKCIGKHFVYYEICKSDDVHTEATANQYLHKRGQDVCYSAAAVGKKEHLGR